jgi:RNA polymerase sigma-70 factor, ECF subfamily
VVEAERPVTGAVTMRYDESMRIEGLRRGDDAVYQDLIDSYYPAMRRLASGYLQDQDLVDDVIQETWIAVMNAIDRFEGRSSLKTWIFRILRNCARTKAARWHRAGSVQLDEATVPCGPASCPEGYVLGREILEQVEAAIQTLPSVRREVLILRDIEGWTSEEVCELLEISRINQRVLLHRARLAVRESLRAYLGKEAYDEVR